MHISQAAHIGEYLQHLRQKRELSQVDLAELGAPYRQAQAAIEGGDLSSIERYARGYDQAYRWPLGMTECLHQHIEARNTKQRHTASYEAQYVELVNVAGEPPRIATLGFVDEEGPDFGRAVTLEPEQTLLTNATPVSVTGVARSRAGITFVDTTLDAITTPDGDTGYLRYLYSDLTRSDAVPDRSAVRYQVGADRDRNSYGERITVDPIKALTGTAGARALAAGLIAAAKYAASPGKVEAIAHTLLGIAAYGGGMRTVTDLARGDIKGYASFLDYWRSTFYDADYAGPALASPDRTVASLLSGLLAARDRDTTSHIDDTRRPATRLLHEGPTLVDVDTWNLGDHIVITYDAALAPEIPVAVTKGFRTGALLYYAADSWDTAASHAVAQYLGSGIGITTADDETVVAARDDKTATLTHWIGPTAIYSPTYGLPRRVYLPSR